MSLVRRHTLKTVFFSCLLLSCTLPVVAQQQTMLKSRAVAMFNNTPITEDDLRKAAAEDLDKLDIQVQQMSANLARTEHQILETNLFRLLEDKLFEAEASKRGITKEAFLEKELAGKIKEPSDQEIQTFYEANKQRLNKPLDQAADQIRQYLRAENRGKAMGEIADRLKAEYGVTVLLPPLRAKVGTEGSPSRGPKEAPVTIVEFSDFQCPYCARLTKTLKEVAAKYGDQVRVVYRHFPVSQIHPLAEKAAEASLCAADQDHFWEMHDLMFETQDKLKDEDLKAEAAKLKLDAGAFDTCLSSGKYAERVKQDQREGYTLGVAVTPALFINGRFFSGALPVSDISKMIDEEIRLQSSRPRAAAAATKVPH